MMTRGDRFYMWLDHHWEYLAVCGAVVVALLIFIGVNFGGGTVDDSGEVVGEHPRPPTSQAAIMPVEEPIEEPSEEAVQPSGGDSANDPMGDATHTAAYEVGAQLGGLFNDTRDAARNLWQGFDESTGASDWARRQLERGRERVNEWFDEQDEHNVE